jgi:hypothetical protein
MKLSQIQEARYHVDHPLIAEIKQAIADKEWNWSKKFRPKDTNKILSILSALGPPDEENSETDTHYANMRWVVDQEDDLCLDFTYGDYVYPGDLVHYIMFMDCSSR